MEELIHKIFKFHPEISNRLISRESSWLEFKETFNWNSKSKYAKSMAAFANNKGGFIVFGVKNKPRDLIGLKTANFEDIDEEKMTEYLNSLFSPEITFEKSITKINGKKVGLLYTYLSENKPVVSIKNDNEIKEAIIYYRYNARSEKIKFPELKILFDQIREREKKSWMNHLEKISKIGSSNAAILDVLNGQIDGDGGTLIIDKKLLPKLRFIKEGNFKQKGWPTLKLIGDVRPVEISRYKSKLKSKVRITDDISAPEIRIKEENLLKDYPLDYYALTKRLAERYVDFKMNSKYHKLKKKFKSNIMFCKVRYLDPNKSSGSKKEFYSEKIIKEFDKFYIPRK